MRGLISHLRYTVRLLLKSPGFTIFKILGTGLVIGILSTLFLSRYVQNLLFGVSANDPISFGLAVLLLGVTGVVACLLPALRAMRTDPIKALRE